jgi:DHA2 family multidrug resistance protein
MADEIPSVAPVTWKPKFNPWLIGMVVALAAFMEVLDTDIANVALPHIAGNLGASNSESTWVLTSYLVSNAIVLPISGWLADFFGRKRFFMLCIFFFSLSSVLCGFAPTLGLLIFFRVLQGAAGGGLQPLSQAILADTFPPALRGMAFAMYGVTVVVAPTLGPVLGGWITDNYSWRWIFFINVPMGLLALALVRRLVEDPPYLLKKKGAGVKIDYIGIALLTLGVGALQVLLDKGQEDDWLGSHFIVTLMGIAAVCLVALFVWEWFHKDPVIEVRLFKNFNFATANLMMFFLGAVYFSSLVLMPQFLQTLLGYNAQTAGQVLGLGGFVLFCTLPLVGQLTSKMQARYMVAIGWLAIVLSMALSAVRMDLLISYPAARWLRIAQSAGLGFLFIPVNLVAYIGLPPEKSSSISGIINFMRNMGSSVGTSMVTTLLDRRSQFHQVHLVQRATTYNPAFQNLISALSDRLGGDAHAYASFYRSVLGQAQALAYIDTYWLLAIAGLVMLALCFVLKRNEPGAGGEIAVG